MRSSLSSASSDVFARAHAFSSSRPPTTHTGAAHARRRRARGDCSARVGRGAVCFRLHVTGSFSVVASASVCVVALLRGTAPTTHG